jgi:hypothetical protein
MPSGAKALDIAFFVYGLKAVPFKEHRVSAACFTGKTGRRGDSPLGADPALR